jgi:dihydrolipoamide dehydrogenase
MTSTSVFDIAVIGSGPGGYPAAIRAAVRGKKVALIEKSLLGGTCLNCGCIPSKALIAGAEALYQIQHAEAFGIQVGNVSFDYAAMVERKDRIVSKIRKGLEGLIASHGVTVIKGNASFISPHELRIESATPTHLRASKIIIASGSEPREISAFPFDGERILDSTNALDLKKLPKKMAIVGGGVIGCEFASLFQLLGVEIVILEMLPSLLPMECSSVSSAITKIFQKRGIAIETSAQVERIEKTKRGVIVHLASRKTYEADLAIVAVGRKMNLEGMGLEKIGIKLKNPSQIAVNEKMETSIPGIYAVGDIASPWWLAHVATHQGLVAADNASGHNAVMHYEAVPNVIFTHPEIATVGLCLEEAKKRGFSAALGNFPFQALGKSQALEHPEGFAQVVIDEKTGQILGAQVVGYEASTLIGEMAVAVQNELIVECIHETIHPHPTLTEAWMEAAFLASGIPLHLPPQKKKDFLHNPL